MLGALIGDIAGSRFEWHNLNSRDFELFSISCHPTDESIMSLAIAKAILTCKDDQRDLSDLAIHYLHLLLLGRKNPKAGYGGRFIQ